MRVSLSVLGKVTKHGVLRCINKKSCTCFSQGGVNDNDNDNDNEN